MKKAVLLMVLLLSANLHAQVRNGYPGRKTRMLFLLDGSGSMLAEMGNYTRWAVAVTLMNTMVDTLRSVNDLEVGLRVFGHNQPNEKKDCNDTKLEVPFAPYNHKQFVQRLKQIKPLGYTSITQSLLASAKDFPADPTARNIIIIITDGVEECGGDPCAVSEALQRKGIILRPFIIGLGTDNEVFRKAYSCAGRYFNAENPSQFQKIIGVIINQALNNTSVQINLLDNQGLPRETDVPLTIFDSDNGQMVENVIHTMNGKGIPDTLYLDPVRRYRVLAHTKPQVVSANIEIVPGKHTVIPLETPQGSLLLKMGGITRYPRLQAIVRKGNQMQTINAQEFNTLEKYLVGAYDLEILSVPRLLFTGVQIKQNQTYTIEIPNPGILQLSIGMDVTGAVFQRVDNKLEWVMDFNGTIPKQMINMQPGEYTAVYRTAGETRTLYSKSKIFKINSGTTTQLSI
ncbi:MAG: von willebrand factor type a [Flavobacteriales bacterium]|nr:VWA domain-containing protein [Flavobacteriaceae bacterium]PHX92071.1 MAG: von willebrand factor type a [Flavobacteriales bacterium]